MNAEFFLNDGGDVREDQVGARRADNDQINILGRDPGALNRIFCCLDAQVGSQLVFSRHMTTFDTGTRANPFVTRIYHLFQIRIGHDAFR